METHFKGMDVAGVKRSPSVAVSATRPWRTAFRWGGTGDPSVLIYQPGTRMLRYTPTKCPAYGKLDDEYDSLEAALFDVANHIRTYERWHMIIKVYPFLEPLADE